MNHNNHSNKERLLQDLERSYSMLNQNYLLLAKAEDDYLKLVMAGKLDNNFKLVMKIFLGNYNHSYRYRQNHQIFSYLFANLSISLGQHNLVFDIS